jgi:hypothetical protein
MLGTLTSLEARILMPIPRILLFLDMIFTHLTQYR